MFGTSDSQSRVAVGDVAPDFSLSDQQGSLVTLSALLQKGPVVVFFYPKDNTMGCTAQVCAFRDAYEDFLQEKASVVGISSDSSTSHRSFADKHGFVFSILSDTGQTTRNAYGVPKSLGFVPGRVTYLVDRTGVVRHIVNSQLNIQSHVTTMLAAVRALKAP